MKLFPGNSIPLFFLALSLSISAFAQDDQKTDSLKHLLEVYTDEVKLLEVNEQLFEYYKIRNSETGLKYAEAYNNLAMKSGDSLKIIKGGRMRAFCLLDFGKYDETVTILNSILKIATRNQDDMEVKKHIKSILNNRGLAYSYLGKYDMALKSHFESVRLRKEEGNTASLPAAYNNIGLVYYTIFQYDDAIRYFKLALEINPKSFEPYENTALALIGQKKFMEAKKIAIDGIHKNVGYTQDYIYKNGYQTLALVYMETKDYDSAEIFFRRSLNSAVKIGDSRFITEDSTNLGKIAMIRGQIDLAIKIFLRTYIRGTRDHLMITRLYSSGKLANLYSIKNDSLNTAKFQSINVGIKDSTYNARLVDNINSIESQYSEKKDTENNKPDFKKNNLQVAVTVGGSAILIFIAVLSFLSARKTFVMIAQFKNLDSHITHYSVTALNTDSEIALSGSGEEITTEKLKQFSNDFLSEQQSARVFKADRWEAATKYLENQMGEINNFDPSDVVVDSTIESPHHKQA
ncbi:MAG TPA: tetratricopeptide repeat protein [Cyclobacteriaceae bacterium]|jgi:tetratricopeptide (TPR) repeat protein|nr:tetratricopeptide repeat protein [Cyclobacteriaceae bacterium]